jgi:glycosyltransferase involved in cell wall biosynthesis/2-polyprenyl-3-methyl-5-hydroxy-6-metoxy-1,4-benzoquinol methylase
MPKVVITMPAYRAEHTLAKTVADIPEGVADQLILVDDASPDDTVRLARSMGIKVFVHTENRGYGGNQKTCYTEALREGADIVVMLHPDYQYDPKAVPLLIAPILAGDADMTFGSRFAGLGDPIGGGMPIYRYLGNRVTTTVENLLLGARFTDMHSGLRAYTRECLLAMPFRSYSDDFMFDSQFIIDAVTSGQRVVEVPIPTRYTKESSSIPIGRSIRYVTHGVGYSSKQFFKRGRRGDRSPVTIQGLRRGRTLGVGRMIERECALCGGNEHVLVYPSNAAGDVPVEEFACTTMAISSHDDIVQCRRCGMVSAIPTLPHEEIVDNYTQVVDDMYLAEETARRELFSWITDATGGYVVPGRRLLEVGSNVGLFLSVARDQGWDVRGIEPSKWAVEQGVTRFGVNLRRGVIEELDEQARSADVVVMLDVLEHVSDPLGALKTLRSVVEDEGLLVLSTVNLSGLHARVRDGNWPWFIRSHLHYFSPETLHAMLALAGFKMVQWEIVPRSFHLSYIVHRAAASHGKLGSIASALTRVVDPKLPVGWIGDIAFVAARPASAAG